MAEGDKEYIARLDEIIKKKNLARTAVEHDGWKTIEESLAIEIAGWTSKLSQPADRDYAAGYIGGLTWARDMAKHLEKSLKFLYNQKEMALSLLNRGKGNK